MQLGKKLSQQEERENQQKLSFDDPATRVEIC